MDLNKLKQTKEAKRNTRPHVKSIERYIHRLQFHTSKNMCVLENDFENQLGEFHIKFKGLAGYARLCAGDKYEILINHERQTWKSRGCIHANGKQLWDGEEVVFLPRIAECLSMKQKHGVFRRRAPSIRLSVENALESFVLLSITSDISEEGHKERL
ncbi:rho family-interacting cell polarization regulator 1-like isoform X2 [Xenopus laevis]|nr:rho family-interacting cell polarization regulator 1-like isoform X2 [Xenopus laevis]